MLNRLLYLLILLMTYKSYSQNGLVFRKLEVPDISSENVNSIFIDNKGFNWISTN